jgi:hypothetical protein
MPHGDAFRQAIRPIQGRLAILGENVRLVHDMIISITSNTENKILKETL